MTKSQQVELPEVELPEVELPDPEFLTVPPLEAARLSANARWPPTSAWR